jgi:hypothetical protein
MKRRSPPKRAKRPSRSTKKSAVTPQRKPQKDDWHDVIKDENRAHPIASAWRPALSEIVRAFVRRDYALARKIASVAPISKSSASQIRAYVSEYGEPLVALPEKTWTTSVSQWMDGFWEVLVDLWTTAGASDMVLHAQVFQAKGGFRIKVHAVYVP